MGVGTEKHRQKTKGTKEKLERIIYSKLSEFSRVQSQVYKGESF